jgi:hypothetical protein
MDPSNLKESSQPKESKMSKIQSAAGTLTFANKLAIAGAFVCLLLLIASVSFGLLIWLDATHSHFGGDDYSVHTGCLPVFCSRSVP